MAKLLVRGQENYKGKFIEAILDESTGRLEKTEIIVDPAQLHHFGSEEHRGGRKFSFLNPKDSGGEWALIKNEYYESIIRRADEIGADYVFSSEARGDSNYSYIQGIATFFLKRKK